MTVDSTKALEIASPERYLSTRDASFRQRHLIPEDPNLWQIEQFEQFVTEREELIRVRLRDVLDTPAILVGVEDLAAA